MNRARTRTRALVASLWVTAVLAYALGGCSDVGDSSAVPGGDTGSPGVDATNPSDAPASTSPADTGTDAGLDSGRDGTMEATADMTVGIWNDTGVGAGNDTGVGAANDTGVGTGSDTGVGAANDTGVGTGSDTGVRGGNDAGLDVVNDTAADVQVDAGADVQTEATVDATTDAGADVEHDANEAASSADVADAGSSKDLCNAFIEANNALDGGGAFLDAGVLGAVSNTCSGTELTLFEKTPAGESRGACLACAFDLGFLDDTFSSHDANHECEDFAIDGGTPADVLACLAVLGCDLGVSPARNAPAAGVVQNAYCGPGIATATCTATPTSPAGLCAPQWTTGFPATFTPASVVGNDTIGSFPGGRANLLASELLQNCGVQCFP